MSKRNKIFSLMLVAVVGLTLAVSPILFSHCQIPCGIYDDYMRLLSMMEDATTVEKAVTMIDKLAGKADAQSQNQLVRWVMNKEKHAENIISTISDYYLTQRVKSDQEDYTERLVKHHAVIVSAMKTKQNVDATHVATLKANIEALAAYYPEHKHE